MAKRPDISVILLYNRGIVRADFKKNSSTPVFKTQETIDVESTTQDAVEQVVTGKSPLGHRAIFISTDVWSQIVALPRLSVTGIEQQELTEALKFEAETLSGIEIDELSLASTTLGRQDDYQQYWVNAIRQSDLDAVNAVLQSAGCREVAVAHPAGVAGSEPTRMAQRTIEVWGDLAYFLDGNGNKLVSVKQASPSLFTPDVPLLMGIDTAYYELDDQGAVRHLSDPVCFDQWAGQVAANYLKRQSELAAPLIRMTKGPSGTPIRHLVSVLVALAVIGFCVWHWNYLRHHNQSLIEKIELMKEPAEAKKKSDTQLIAILEQRTELELEEPALGRDLKRIQFFLDTQSSRIANLLTQLADLRGPELVIDQIVGNESGILISGVSLNGEAAQALAKRLREVAVPLGWGVKPASQEGQQKLTTGGPWDYEILLTDTGPFESAVQPRKPNQVSKNKH